MFLQALDNRGPLREHSRNDGSSGHGMQIANGNLYTPNIRADY